MYYMLIESVQTQYPKHTLDVTMMSWVVEEDRYLSLKYYALLQLLIAHNSSTRNMHAGDVPLYHPVHLTA